MLEGVHDADEVPECEAAGEIVEVTVIDGLELLVIDCSTEGVPVSLPEVVIVSEGVTESLGDMLREEDGLLTADSVAEDDSVPLTEALIVFENPSDSLADSDALDVMLRERDDEALGDDVTLSLPLEDGLGVALKEMLVVSDDVTDSVVLENSLSDELKEGVAEGNCVPEKVALGDPDSVALPLPEALSVMVAVGVPLKVAVEDGDWLDDPLPDADMLELSEQDAVPDIDDEEMTEENPETLLLGELDSLKLWLPLSVVEGVDVSQDDSLRELDDDPVLLGVPVELADGNSDKLDDPVEDGERLLLSEEVPELLCEALSVTDDVSLVVWL